jgi:non-specific serine/threonine protein kinase
VLSVPQLADRLLADTSLLAAPPGAQPRQPTLRATLEWSLALLEEPERQLFEQLSVFAGDFSLEAAEAVVGGHILPSFARLVSASLVVQETEAGRYRLLEPLRQLGEQRLVERDAADAARDRHAAHFLELAEAQQGQLWGRTARHGGVVRLERELDNLRAAQRWLLRRGSLEAAGRLGAAMGLFWLFSGRVGEGRVMLAELLGLPGLSVRTCGRLAVGAAAAATYELDLSAATEYVTSGLELTREADDDWASSWALFLVAWASLGSLDSVDVPRVLGLCSEGARRSRASGDAVLELMHDLTGAAAQILGGQVEQGEACAQQALQRATSVGAPREVARANLFLGIARYVRGDLASARDRLLSARAAWEASGEAGEVPWFLTVTGLVLVAADLGDARLARTSLAGLVDVWSSHGRQPHLAGACLGAAAYLAAAERHAARFVRTCAVLSAYQQTLDVLRYFGRSVANQLVRAREALGDAAAANAWAQGRVMSLEDACQSVLVDAGQALAHTGRGRVAGGLTRREAEVLRLVADGHTTREVADARALSQRTVAKHLDHVFSKLGVSSRAAAVAFAVRAGLA